MFPSPSSRVKLNRVALKDVVGLKLAPRRRRHVKSSDNITADSRKQEESLVPCCSQPVNTFLTHQIGPENIRKGPSNTPEGEPEESCVGKQTAVRKINVHSCKGDNMEVKPDGPNTRGRYQQGKPNTRCRWRLQQLRKQLGRFKCSWCPRRVLDNAVSEQSQVKVGVKLSQMSSLMERRKFKRLNINRESGGSKAVRSREGQGSERPRSAGCGPQPAAAAARPAGTPSLPSTLPNTDSCTPPNPAGLAGSEGYLRRAVKASHCVLCGEGTYISPQRKTSGKQAPLSTSPDSEPTTAELKINRTNPVAETSKKTLVWISQYPKVTLCDVAKSCDACSHNCGYVLPDVLKTKAVHCFKQDMRAGFWFVPTCGRNKHKSEVRSLAQSSECCPSGQHEKSIDQSQSLTEHQRHLEEGTDSQTLSRRNTCFHKSWTSEDPATCSASFLLGKHTNKGRCRAGMWDRVSKEDPGPGSDWLGGQICRDNTLTLGDGVGGTFSSAAKENCITKETCYQRVDPTQMSSELFCQENEVDTEGPESFTCQRVRVYFRERNFSCARTYMSWPFLNSSLTLKAHVAPTACSAGSIDPSARGDSVTVNQNQPGSSSCLLKDMLPNAPTEKRGEDGESILTERNGKRHSDRKDMEIALHLTRAEESLASLHSDTASFSTPGQRGREPASDTVSASSLLVNGPETDSSTSTPSPSTLGLSDCEAATTLSPMSSSFTQGDSSSLSATPSSLPPSSFLLKKVKGVELKAVEKTWLYCEETQMTARSSPSSATLHSLDSFHSCESSLLLPQDEHESDEELLTDRSPPQREPYYDTNPFKYNLAVAHGKEGSLLCNVYNSNDLLLLPVLSPVSSPQGHLWRRSFSCQRSGCSDEDGETNNDTSKNKTLSACLTPQIGNGNKDDSKDYQEHSVEELEGVSSSFQTDGAPRESQFSPSSDEDDNEEESQDEADYRDNVEQGIRSYDRVLLDPKIKTPLTTGVLTERSSSPGSEDDDAAFSDEEQQHGAAEKRSSPSKGVGSERDESKAEEIDDSQPGILDEFTAYEQDILLVDVIQDDPELFNSLPEQSLLKLGPARVAKAPKSKPTTVVKTLSSRMDGASLVEYGQRLTPVTSDFHCNSPDVTDGSYCRQWRPQSSTTPTATDEQTKNVGLSNASNNHVNGGLERSQPIQTVSSPHSIPPLMFMGNGPWIPNAASVTDFRRHKSDAYCRHYFSESLTCGFKMCRFQHLPVEGDEKFCVETVTRFTKNPMCLQKAGAVFTGYYQNNPPGAYFSLPVLLSLLWSLLKAGMVSDLFSVLSVSLDHNVVPGPEFLLALFNCVREKGLMGLVPELMQLTFKMVSAGLELSLDCFDSVKNTPALQQTVHPHSPVSVSGNHKLSTSTPIPECLNLAPAIVEIELCTKQEDWRQMGEVFRSICQSSQHPNQVERISGRIAIALLSESKDKLSLPFVTFAETVYQNEHEDSLIRSFVGRIGVSLMLRYHKTHQWAKGRRVVEMLSISKINYSTLKGLFGNEDGASRCYLVTVATELFLLSGSVEGALKTLRESQWFLSSSSWQCEAVDLEGRTRVMIRLAEKTSHRNTLEVLCNLPGIKEPNDLIDTSRYSSLFNSHLQVCVDRQILLVASDTADLMLSKNLAVEHTVLQILLHKLGKQNLWLRAREVFRHALSVGYYPAVSAPPGFMALIVPCQLGEVELALTFEMFIAVNATGILQISETATSSPLSVTLKRTQSCESDYLSAGSRLLSAACIPQPKLTVHYTAVNSSQEQVFTLDVSSARRWLQHNRMWANEVWTH